MKNMSDTLLMAAKDALMEAIICLKEKAPIPEFSLNAPPLPANPYFMPSLEELSSRGEIKDEDSGFYCGICGHGLQNNRLVFLFISAQLRIAITLPIDRIFNVPEYMEEDARQIEGALKAVLLLFDAIHRSLPALERYDNMIFSATCNENGSAFVLKKDDEIYREADTWQPVINFLDDSITGTSLSERIYV